MEILRNPRTGNPLRLIVDSDENGELVDDQSGDKFMIREGIPVFVSENELSGFNKKYQGLYNRIAPFYDISTSLFALFKSGGEKKRRLEYLNELEIKDGDKVLEISVGTGANLRFLPSGADYYGVDITWGMLKQCRKKIKKNNLKVELFQCAAEAVCFKDEAFDVVFHVGGINFFNDKERAILEMIRLAKPGT